MFVCLFVCLSICLFVCFVIFVVFCSLSVEALLFVGFVVRRLGLFPLIVAFCFVAVAAVVLLLLILMFRLVCLLRCWFRLSVLFRLLLTGFTTVAMSTQRSMNKHETTTNIITYNSEANHEQDTPHVTRKEQK